MRSKRLLSLALALVMVLALAPAAALAAEGDPTDPPKLAAPSELTWHKEIYYNSDGEKTEIDDPRFVSWKTNAPVNCGATVTVFHKGPEETEFTKIGGCDVDASDGDQIWEYGTRWIWHALVDLVNADNYEDPIPGTYKFTVQLHADGYQDSDVVESAEWTYADPGRRLDAPPTLIWDDDNQTVTWSEDVGDAQMFCAEIRIYYSDSKLEGDSLNEQNLEIVESLLFRDDKVISNLCEDVFEKEGYYYARAKFYTADYNEIKDSEWSEYSFLLHYVDTRTKLPTPIDLQWDRFWYRDDEGTVHTTEAPLCMSWTFEEGALDDLPQNIGIGVGIFQVNDDPDGKDRLIDAWHVRFSKEEYDSLYYYGLYEDSLDLETGKYYFIVSMETDDPNLSDSDTVRSPVLEYTRPTTKLTTPSKLVGGFDDELGFRWTGTWGDTTHHDKGYVFRWEYYYSADNGEATSVNDLRKLPGQSYAFIEEEGDDLSTNIWVQHMDHENPPQPGYYYCRVRATSRDLKTVLHSDWSELSAGTYLYPLLEDMIQVDLSDETYTGKPITKKVTVKAGDKTLVEGTDYTVNYRDNVNVSTDDTKATVVVSGKGIYSGGASFWYEFTIKAKPSGGGSTGGGGGSTNPPKPTEPEKPVEPEKPTEPEAPSVPASETFGDVVKDSWYEAGVTYVTGKGLFQGVSEGVFAPSANMTRSMLMTVLARLDGQETEGGATWYAKAMDWAKAQGISDGSAPDGNVTREQLVTMLYRYAKPEAVKGDLGQFDDADNVSAWAQEAMEWAVANGIVTGKGSSLDPKGTATRAEVAAMIQRFADKTEK